MSTLSEGSSKQEIQKLRNDLDSNDHSLRKAAAKTTVALMRGGENVRILFASMLRCVKTDDMELKKLAYLYIVQYSSQEPEQAIMAVNTFIKDSQDPNPLVRALAVRTMCRIKLESVAENMILPLKKCLSDPDPYVRKTATFSVAKLYEIIPEAVENAGLFKDLLALLKDENPMVVSNTTATIFEINERRTTPIFKLTSDTIGPILAAITSCSEWCQTILFDSLSHYHPETADDAAFLIDRLIPFLKHANPAVVIGAFKCIFLFIDQDKRGITDLFPQIIPPFITLVSSTEPEIQYVVLRTLSLFVNKYPKSLAKEIRVFFCKYNDPSYVKMEKLDIIVTICTTRSAKLVLDELSEYANSVDVAFVRKAIKAIGQIAIKIESAARRCVDILSNLVKGKADYALEESICVVTDILRKYPGEFEGIIPTVCANLENVKDAKAKAAAIWIIGEYCRFIDNADEIIDPFLDTFHDEPPTVQLQLLTAIVKVYLERPESTADQLQFVVTEATKDGNAPDVKNRAYLYWRVLSQPSEIAKAVVAVPKDSVDHSGNVFEPTILAELIRNMGNAAGVLHVVPSDFVRRVRYVPEDEEDVDEVIRDWHQVVVSSQQTLDVFSDYDSQHIFLRLVNRTIGVLGDFAFAVNTNAVGLALSGPGDFPQSLQPGEVAEVSIPITFDSSRAGNFGSCELQMALKTSAETVYGADRIPVLALLLPSGDRGADAFRDGYANFQAVKTVTVQGSVADKGQLKERKVFMVGKNQNRSFVQFEIIGGSVFVAEIAQNEDSFSAEIKGSTATLLDLVAANARELFAQ